MHNYIIGTMYFWIYGHLVLRNLDNGDRLCITFKPKGFFQSKSNRNVQGSIADAQGNVFYSLQGSWNTQAYLKAVNVQTQEETLISQRAPSPPKYEHQYYFSSFTINLNHLPIQLLYDICPTDSRLRPDMRAYEYGDLELSGREKTRLEENQRRRRKKYEDAGSQLRPYWFTFELQAKEIRTSYKGGYFECRERRKWPDDLHELFIDN